MNANALTGIAGTVLGAAVLYLSTLPALAPHASMLQMVGVGLLTGGVGWASKQPATIKQDRAVKKAKSSIPTSYMIVLLLALAGCASVPGLDRAAEKAAPLLLELAKQKGMLLEKADAVCVPVPEEAVPDEVPGVFVMCYAPEAEGAGE